MARILGRIAAVLNPRSVVINRGAEHGVEKNMMFAIQLMIPPIQDPDDPSNVLEGIFFEKGRVVVGSVFPKMSYARVVPQTSIGRTIKEMARQFPNVSGPYRIDDSEWTITEGDTVAQVLLPAATEPGEGDSE